MDEFAINVDLDQDYLLFVHHHLQNKVCVLTAVCVTV